MIVIRLQFVTRRINQSFSVRYFLCDDYNKVISFNRVGFRITMIRSTIQFIVMITALIIVFTKMYTVDYNDYKVKRNDQTSNGIIFL